MIAPIILPFCVLYFGLSYLVKKNLVRTLKRISIMKMVVFFIYSLARLRQDSHLCLSERSTGCLHLSAFSLSP